MKKDVKSVCEIERLFFFNSISLPHYPLFAKGRGTQLTTVSGDKAANGFHLQGLYEKKVKEAIESVGGRQFQPAIDNES